MLKHNNTYHNYLATNWVVALLLLISIGGYTNYTQPVSNSEVVELVISSNENQITSISFSEISIDQHHVDATPCTENYIKLISKRHTTIASAKHTIWNTSIYLSNTHSIFLFRNQSYSSEEDSFLIG
ncbi:hypothetical protein [Aquimarina sp. 2201CG14-23]|uniref:hypothetical protein n=1 Tax=Aquimarina mycalae TaxID=3040073 RepID=UPI002477F946|nr:hypothetical protein [Aquimarina sp. 2201CG14-23]MDH7444620.1 hypothetical protein [Aquimarina sp. 2201CG14-23]